MGQWKPWILDCLTKFWAVLSEFLFNMNYQDKTYELALFKVSWGSKQTINFEFLRAPFTVVKLLFRMMDRYYVHIKFKEHSYHCHASCEILHMTTTDQLLLFFHVRNVFFFPTFSITEYLLELDWKYFCHNFCGGIYPFQNSSPTPWLATCLGLW